MRWSLKTGISSHSIDIFIFYDYGLLIMSDESHKFSKSAFKGFLRRAGFEAWEPPIIEHLIFEDGWGGASL